jgi:ketosteroid isomerase-like protein
MVLYAILTVLRVHFLGGISVTRMVFEKETVVEQVEVTREVEVTRVVKETVTEQVEVTREVEVTANFDAEAEKEAIAALSKAYDDARENGDREATRAILGEDWTVFMAFPDSYFLSGSEDEGPDWWTEPEFNRWDSYEILVSTDLAVMRGYQTLNYNTDPVHAYVTSVLKKENGRWRVIHSHASYAGE